MENEAKDSRLVCWSSYLFYRGQLLLLMLLQVGILLALAASATNTLLDAWSTIHQIGHPSKEAIPVLLADVLSCMALIEVFHTAQAYLREGRVRVTYIIDTVLVAVLSEVIAFWHVDFAAEKLAMLLVLVLCLMFVRIMAIRFSPHRRKLAEGL